MFQRIAVLATCAVLAAILLASVGCGPAGLGPVGTNTATAGSSGSVRGFPFVEIGKKYVFGGATGLTTVKQDLGGGWILVEQSGSYVNLNAVSNVTPEK